jgi:hypothetical protein
MLNNAKGQNETLLDIKAATRTLFNLKNYAETSDEVREAMLYLHLLMLKSEKTEYPIVKHPAHDLLLPAFEEHIRNINQSIYADVVFGDSMTDMPREWLTAFDGIYSISGSWSNHMLDMYMDLRIYLRHRRTNSVSVGTLAGNPLLLYMRFDDCVKQAMNTLNYMRSDLPEHIKLIVFGCPPSHNINLTESTLAFDEALIRWVLNTPNTYFVSLKEYGRGFYGIFPDEENQVDALHFNAYGARKFSKRMKSVMISKDQHKKIYI